MTVYVDPLLRHGWVMRGRVVSSCHLFTDAIELDELHQLASAIGLRSAWFQRGSTPHYDLTPASRALALSAGAVAVERRQAVDLWRARRAAIAAHTTATK